MDNETFFNGLTYIILWNTLPVAWFAGLCFFWAYICRTGAKKMIFSGVGGVLGMYCLFRLLMVFVLPLDLDMVSLSGMGYGIVMMLAALVFTVATVIAHRRGQELAQAEKRRKEAQDGDLMQHLEVFEDRLTDFAKLMAKHGFC